MANPVICADGHSYERGSIERWLAAHGTSPLTGRALPHKARPTLQTLTLNLTLTLTTNLSPNPSPNPSPDPNQELTPNHRLRSLIQELQQSHELRQRRCAAWIVISRVSDAPFVACR